MKHISGRKRVCNLCISVIRGEYEFKYVKYIDNNSVIATQSMYKISLTKAEIETLDIEDENLCKICFDNELNCTLEPCGHKELCSVCAKFLKLCPFCRCEIKNTIINTESAV